MYDLTLYPVASLYSVLALVTAVVGVGMIVWQTGATQHALLTRRGILVGGVLLILIAGLVGTTQVLAIVSGSYGGLPGNVP
ncbi:hypothetical protein [Amnibacterium endophyticum]|uniref:Integral membrane protein n=1 Tax=Amnibacterium endophyticum TaxID=2109337 RepID=A0ABW4LDC8_9MICO